MTYKAAAALLVLLAGVVSSTEAMNSMAARVTMESDRSSWCPEGWVVSSQTPDKQTPIELVFAIKQRNLDYLEQLTLQISDPDNTEMYGHHLSLKQIGEIVSPTQDVLSEVVEFLMAHDVTEYRVTPNKEFIRVYTTMGIAEALLGARYSMYRHEESGTVLQRLSPGLQYSLPKNVARHVDFVAPTLRFPRLEGRKQANRAEAMSRARAMAEGQDGNVGNGTIFVTPNWLRQLYGVGDHVGNMNNRNRQAVASFIGQFWRPDDLKEFIDLFGLPLIKNNTIAKQIGKNDPSNPGLEANLDTQTLMSVGANIETWVWYTAGNTSFITWLEELAKTPEADMPSLFSVSYGEYENGDPKDYLMRCNTEFMKLAARGVTVLMAAGDSGAAGNCTGDRQSPDFPASSPWVTTVGGLVGGDAGVIPTGETVDYIGGGGFSDTFARPSYQADAVANFLKTSTKLPKANAFNANGRGYPDLAAQSEMFIVVEYGVPMPGVGGTSCATPTTAGVVSLLNERRLANGKSALGFLNPLLYKTAATTKNAFSDVVKGSNQGCSLVAFTAQEGWDAASGLGSLNYAVLSQVVDSLP